MALYNSTFGNNTFGSGTPTVPKRGSKSYLVNNDPDYVDTPAPAPVAPTAPVSSGGGGTGGAGGGGMPGGMGPPRGATPAPSTSGALDLSKVSSVQSPAPAPPRTFSGGGSTGGASSGPPASGLGSNSGGGSAGNAPAKPAVGVGSNAGGGNVGGTSTGAPGGISIPITPASFQAGGNSQVFQTMEKYYNDLLTAQDKSWQQQQGNLNAQMEGQMRRGDLLSNRLGFTAGGGGYSQMSADALAQGMQVYNQADVAHQQQVQNTMKNWMDAQIQEAQRQENQQWTVDQTKSSQDFQLKQGDLNWQRDQANRAQDRNNQLEDQWIQGIMDGTLKDVTLDDFMNSYGKGQAPSKPNPNAPPLDASGNQIELPKTNPDGTYQSADGTTYSKDKIAGAAASFNQNIGITNMNIPGGSSAVTDWMLTQKYDPGMMQWGPGRFQKFFNTHPGAWQDFVKYFTAKTGGVAPVLDKPKNFADVSSLEAYLNGVVPKETQDMVNSWKPGQVFPPFKVGI